MAFDWDTEISVKDIEVRGWQDDPHTRVFNALKGVVTARQVANDIIEQLTPYSGCVIITSNAQYGEIKLVGYESDKKRLVLELEWPAEVPPVGLEWILYERLRG